MTETQTNEPDVRFASTEQFNKVLLRWMPKELSAMPEGKLVAGIFAQAWSDGSSWFFKRDCQSLHFWCEKTGLNADSLVDLYEKHNREYAKQQGLL